MAETKTFKGSMSSAYGKDLDKAIPFSGSYEHLAKGDPIPAKEQLSEEDIYAVVNNKRKASAVQAARQEALKAAGITAPTNEDPETALSNMVKILIAQGKNPDEALAIAKTVLGQ